MLDFLIWAITFGIIAYIVFLVLQWLPLPAPIKQIAIVILAGLALIIFLQRAYPLLAGGHF